MEEELEQLEEKNEIVREKKSPYFLLGMCCGLFIGLLALLCYVFIGKLNVSANGTVGIPKNKTEILTNEVKTKVELIGNFIDTYYLNEPVMEDVEDGIYKGIVAGLGDPYAAYYNKEELEKIMEKNKGSFYGVGLLLSQDRDTLYITVVEPMKDTPAYDSGIEAGDVLYAVDDEVVLGQELSDVVLKVKGELGTTVKLTMYRDGEYMDYELKRAEIKSETVKFEMLDDNVACITISSFDQITYEQFKDALEESEEKDSKGLIIDLRGNPGGDLATVIKIADLLLPKGLIVYTEDKTGAKKEYFSDEENVYEKPLVVLVNQNSASASEILSGAIKDYGIGTLVGKKTFGKGIVQRILSMGDGSALKLTISNYYTPNGNNIQGIGIEPDIDIDFDYDKYEKDGTDNQLEKAKEIIGKEINKSS